MSDETETELDVPLRSVAIERLIEEIKVDRERGESGLPPLHAYDRTYTRHNRS
jgi:hypothetical protein